MFINWKFKLDSFKETVVIHISKLHPVYHSVIRFISISSLSFFKTLLPWWYIVRWCFFIAASPTPCTFTGEVLLQQLILCTSRKRQDVNGCCVCHSSTKSPDPLVLLVGNDRQPEAWKKTHVKKMYSLHLLPHHQWNTNPVKVHITHLPRSCSPGPDPGVVPTCCLPCCSGRRSTVPAEAAQLTQRYHSRSNYTHTPQSHDQSF